MTSAPRRIPSRVRAAASAGFRCGNGVSAAVTTSNAATFRREPLQQTRLVLDAALLQHIAAGVVARRRCLDCAQRDGPAQGRKLAAGEVAAEIGGREREAAVGEVHGAGR